MTFEEILDQAIAMLQQHGRLTYGTLKRQFQLDDAALEDLKNELIEGQRLAVDERGNVLVWTGTEVAPPSPTAFPTSSQDRAPLAYIPAYLAEKILTSRSALEGERKQVTVLFADLKGSMELLAERDPEEARQLLDPVLQRMMAAVHRYEGTVNQVMGDGIMALFGAPLTHEDHACALLCCPGVCRTRCAATARRCVARTVWRCRSALAFNSGEVVVRAIGNDLHMDYSAIGETTHLAARMEQLAPPGTIRLTAATLRLVEGFMRVNVLGPVPVKGLPAPVEVFDLVGASALRRRLQTAAVIGTEVPMPLLQAIAELPEAAFHHGLAHLQAAEFLYETRLFPEQAYTFKHALTHEVAYGGLLQERRRVLHARIVEVLEALAGDRVAEQVERLAHHALRGELWGMALAYCRQAGEKAMARSAHGEAVGYFEQALSALPHLPETRATREQAIDLRLALRSALLPSGDLRRILAVLHEAEPLAVALNDPRRVAQVSHFLTVHFSIIGVYDQAIAAGERALAMASGDVVLHALANFSLGGTYDKQGNYRQAIDCFGQTVASLTGHSTASVSVGPSCLRCNPVPPSLGAMPS